MLVDLLGSESSLVEIQHSFFHSQLIIDLSLFLVLSPDFYCLYMCTVSTYFNVGFKL